MIDDQKIQEKYEDCMEIVTELVNIMTIVLSTNSFESKNPLEIVEECVKAIREYDSLSEAEKAKYEAEEEEILGMFEKVKKLAPEKELNPEVAPRHNKSKTKMFLN